MDWARSEVAFGIRLQRRHHVHPVQGMQVIEMHDMVVDILAGNHEIADQLGIVGNGIIQGILHGAYRGDAVHQGTDAADTLGEGPGVARVASLQDDLDAAHHGAGTGGLLDHAIVAGFRLDAQMALDAGDGIDYDSFAHASAPLPALLSSRCSASSSVRLSTSTSMPYSSSPSSSMLRQLEQVVTMAFTPMLSSWLFLRLKALRRSGSARSLVLHATTAAAAPVPHPAVGHFHEVLGTQVQQPARLFHHTATAHHLAGVVEGELHVLLAVIQVQAPLGAELIQHLDDVLHLEAIGRPMRLGPSQRMAV
jgi:hypothetical protein